MTRLIILVIWLAYIVIHRFVTKDISEDTYAISASVLWATIYISEILLGR